MSNPNNDEAGVRTEKKWRKTVKLALDIYGQSAHGVVDDDEQIFCAIYFKIVVSGFQIQMSL